ncbi:MAG: ATP-binding cassette domain-containing protein [Alphaproteobacteria bacterium]|nr:ATP-binding cassette domain-containing protein [Alphaproteobacteria bacterium]
MILIENAYRKLVGKKRTVEVRSETIRLQDSELALLTGPNGFGKTTLLRLIAGSVSLHGGKITADRPLFCITDIENQLDPKLTPLENFHYLCAYFDHDLPGRAASIDALERCGAGALLPTVAGKFSKGQKARVFLAFLMATRFKSILLDEPNNGLDYEGEQLVQAVMEEKRADGAAIILATHSPEKLLEKATTLIVKNTEDRFEQIDPRRARFTRSVIARLKDGTMHHVSLDGLKDFLIRHDHQLLDIITERTVAIG